MLVTLRSSATTLLKGPMVTLDMLITAFPRRFCKVASIIPIFFESSSSLFKGYDVIPN